MRYTVSAPDAPLHAGIQLPASKSISNRALILHALAHGKQTLHNLSDCDRHPRMYVHCKAVRSI